MMFLLQVKAFAESGQAANGQDVRDILHYIVHEKTSEKEYQNGIRDKGRGSIALADFLCHRKAQVLGTIRSSLGHNRTGLARLG
jgi:hypothetical protein